MTKKEKVVEEKKTTEQEPQQEAHELNPAETKEVRIIERIIENKEIAPADTFGKLSRTQIELIKRTVAKGATDDELRLFIQVCKGANLNPFLKQVHLVKRWDSKTGGEVGTIQVGIDGFRAVAESSGQYAGNDDPLYDGDKEIEVTTGKDEKSKRSFKITVPGKATVTVYKLLDGQRYGFTATARWEEYYPGAKMGFQWHQRPYLMLGKCAEALALRKAFPKLLSGMYAAEEMDRSSGEANEAEKVSKGFETIKAAIDKASLEELDEFQDKMAKSTKYTAAQKYEFSQAVEKRRKELKPENKGKETKE